MNKLNQVELYKQSEKVQQIKAKINAKILAYITTSKRYPRIDKTKQYIREWASKTLKNANPCIINEIADYAGYLQNIYLSNVSVDYLLHAYIQENQKGETK